MQKYKQAVEQYNKNQSEIVELNAELEELKSQKFTLEERVRNLKLSNEHYEANYVDKTSIVRAEAKARWENFTISPEIPGYKLQEWSRYKLEIGSFYKVHWSKFRRFSPAFLDSIVSLKPLI